MNVAQTMVAVNKIVATLMDHLIASVGQDIL
jgi:hypothetical protein